MTLKLFAVVCLGAAALFVGCGDGDDTTTIIQTTTTPPPATTTTPSPTTTEPAPGSEHIENPTPDDYHNPLSLWPVLDTETKLDLAAVFLNNNPNDCGALIERTEDAPFGVREFVDRAATEPRLQDNLISDAMLLYCQKFSGG